MSSVEDFILLILLTIVCTNNVLSSEGPSLCDNLYIYGADRLPNNTVRVYRDQFYWDLLGFPDLPVNVEGPFRIWQENMGAFDEYSSIQTVTSGQLEGVTFKYNGDRYWSWHPDGRKRTVRKDGEIWDKIPKTGFYATYNDGNLDQKGFSQMIAFAEIHVYYYNTNGKVFHSIGDPNGYKQGKNGEKFPADLTAAFAFPNPQNSTNYWVYLFRRDMYCFRTYLGVDGCPEWRENRELFGCPPSLDTKTESPVTIASGPKPSDSKQNSVEKEGKVTSLSNISTELNFNLFILCLIKFFI